MEAFQGTWKRLSCENEEALQKAIDIPPAILEGFKKNAHNVRVSMSLDGDTYIGQIDCPGMPSHKEEFKLGVPFKSKDMIGFDSNVCVTLEDGKRVEKRSSPGKYEMVITSSVSGNKMTSIQAIGDIKATSVWEKC